jgi:hypothetical protein
MGKRRCSSTILVLGTRWMDMSGDFHTPDTLTTEETCIYVHYMGVWEGGGFSGLHEEEINTLCS